MWKEFLPHFHSLNSTMHSWRRRVIQLCHINSNLPKELKFRASPGMFWLSSFVERKHDLEANWAHYLSSSRRRVPPLESESKCFLIMMCFTYVKSTKPFHLPPHRRFWNPCAMAPQRMWSEKTEMGNHLTQHPETERTPKKLCKTLWSRLYKASCLQPLRGTRTPGEVAEEKKEGMHQSQPSALQSVSSADLQCHGNASFRAPLYPSRHLDRICSLSGVCSLPPLLLRSEFASGKNFSKCN